MTQEMQKQIEELRLKGLGYKSVATVVGTTKENVRYYCKTHGLMGKADLAALNFEEHKKNPEHCKHCGGKIDRNPRSGLKLYCSEQCRRAWWKENNDKSNHSKQAMYELECHYCKREFKSYGNENRKYCCHDCYIKDRFWTDPNIKVDAKEIRNRQIVHEKQERKLVIRRIY